MRRGTARYNGHGQSKHLNRKRKGEAPTRFSSSLGFRKVLSTRSAPATWNRPMDVAFRGRERIDEDAGEPGFDPGLWQGKCGRWTAPGRHAEGVARGGQGMASELSISSFPPCLQSLAAGGPAQVNPPGPASHPQAALHVTDVHRLTCWTRSPGAQPPPALPPAGGAAATQSPSAEWWTGSA